MWMSEIWLSDLAKQDGEYILIHRPLHVCSPEGERCCSFENDSLKSAETGLSPVVLGRKILSNKYKHQPNKAKHAC